MDDNLAAINSVVDTTARLIQDLTRQWTDFAQKTAAAASLDPSIDSILDRVKANFDVVRTIRQTICVQELAQTALSEARERVVRAREHEKRMKSMADELEQLVQQARNPESPPQPVEDSPESQHDRHAVLASKLETATANMVTREEFERQIRTIRQLQDQIRNLSGEPAPAAQVQLCRESSPVPEQHPPAEQAHNPAAPENNDPQPGELEAPDIKRRQDQQGQGEEEAARKRRRVRDPAMIDLTDEEKRRLSEFRKIYHKIHPPIYPLNTLLGHIVPDEGDGYWDPAEIVDAFRRVCAHSRLAAGNMLHFMRGVVTDEAKESWYCAYRTAGGLAPGGLTPHISSNGACSYCDECLQITPYGHYGPAHVGRTRVYRVRLVRRQSRYVTGRDGGNA